MKINTITPHRFIHARKRHTSNKLQAVSLFSGAGLSDLGYQMAGFNFVVQCELDSQRAELGKRNFPNSHWIVGDISKKSAEIIKVYQEKSGRDSPDLLSLTPPCQGLSSSNPGRGKISDPRKSDERNTLILEALPIIKKLKPRVIVVENVAPLLNRVVKWKKKTQTLMQVFAGGIRGYELFAGVVEMADYGIPQNRKRFLLIAIRDDEPVPERLKATKLLPWPRPTHAQLASFEHERWMSIREWFKEMNYPPLDARTRPSDANLHLHFVPAYPEGDRRYTMVSSIPPHSGRNAYTNDICPNCHKNSIARELAYCPHCEAVLSNRPITVEDGKWRLIKGFDSSYRRAGSNRPAPTITTNSSHLGSDNKIHPWENRVLSALECADLQTVPRFYDWSWALETKHRYLIRNAIGEALPPYFTYLHGHALVKMLNGILPKSKLSRKGLDGQERKIEIEER